MIQYRLPFIEVSVRKVLAHFGIKFIESNKFSCCPEPNGIKNLNSKVYNAVASRNLALADLFEKDILTPCNGCFETLRGVRSEIKVNSHFRKKINQFLNKIDLHVSGKSEIFHLIEFFSKIGRDVINENIRYPLSSLRVAVHYGCHFLRPSNKKQMDNPIEPHIFDRLIEDMGAMSIYYDYKMDCCGGSLERAGNSELALEIIRKKLESINQEKADLIVVGCPQCFIQFDHLQQELKKLDFAYDIPVLYYSELLCIVSGIDIKDIMKKHHRTQVDTVFEKIEKIHIKNEKIKEYFDIEFLKKCYACSACDNDCPVAKLTDFQPSNIIGKLLEGKFHDIISDSSIWMCLDCYLCYEFCPLRVGLVEIFTLLRNMASENGIVTKGFEEEYNSFYKKGIVPMISKSARKRVGLDSLKPQLDDLKIIFNFFGKKEV